MFVKEDKWSAFGHYVVGADPSPIYHLKLALEQKRDHGGDIKFIFHDQLYTASTPKLEPSTDLLELYVQRVHQLRQKYDHIVLLYSGGADSHNILKCFEHADVKLDEIVSFVDSSYKGKDSKISSEVYQVALPEVTEYQSKFPDSVYRLLEIREIQNKLFRDTSFKFDLYQDMGYHIIPFSVMHFYGLMYIDEYHALHQAGKKVCVLHGIEKPLLRHQGNKWAFTFSDFSSMFGHKHYYRDFATHDEFFYWSPDAPLIPIKQAHIAAKYMDYLDLHNTQTPYRNNEMANVVIRKSGVHTNWEYFNHMIYPFWKQGTFSTGKTFESRISNGRDDTLTQSNDELLRNYKRAVVKTLMLAKQTNRHMTPKMLSNATDSKSVIGIRPVETMYHFIE